MTDYLLAGALLMAAGVIVALAFAHLLQGPDEAAQFRRAAGREQIRQEMDTAWINGPIVRRINRQGRSRPQRRYW